MIIGTEKDLGLSVRRFEIYYVQILHSVIMSLVPLMGITYSAKPSQHQGHSTDASNMNHHQQVLLEQA